MTIYTDALDDTLTKIDDTKKSGVELEREREQNISNTPVFYNTPMQFLMAQSNLQNTLFNNFMTWFNT